jgi:glutamine synthetase
MMDLMREVAQRHGLAAILHEKPFAGVNGSGKHNNWSMATDTGLNLLEPGDNPAENLKFLTFLAITIKAVDEHADLLRAAIATAPGNDYRLGANEAPPAIMSIYLGSEMDALVESIVSSADSDGSNGASPQDHHVKLGGNIAAFKKDSTDRNRTSPFAFTGTRLNRVNLRTRDVQY